MKIIKIYFLEYVEFFNYLSHIIINEIQFNKKEIMTCCVEKGTNILAGKRKFPMLMRVQNSQTETQNEYLLNVFSISEN